MNPLNFLAPDSSRAWLAFAFLAAAGFAGNLLRIEISLAFFYLFGSVPVLLVLRYFGLRCGLIAALTAASATLLFFGHPYAIVWLTLEIAFVGFFLQRGPSKNLIFYDALYWALLGAPLNIAAFIFLMDVSLEVGLLIAAKNTVNGITNATIASLLIHHLPLRRWLLGREEDSAVSLHQMLYSLMAGFLLLPSLVMVGVHMNGSVAGLETHVRDTLQEKRHVVLQAVQHAREKIRESPGAPEKFLFPVLQEEAGSGPWNILVLEKTRILFSSLKDLSPGMRFDPGAEAELRALGAGIFHRVPSRQNFFSPMAERWKNSVYFMRSPLEARPGWDLLIEKPIAPFMSELRAMVTRIFFFLVVVIYLALALAWLFSRRVADPLKVLSSVTTRLPVRMEEGERRIVWPASNVQEIAVLIGNCREMEDALRERFKESLRARENLEQCVLQRTRQLAEANTALEAEVAEHRRTGRILEDSEQRYQTLAEASPVGIFHTDATGRCLYVNEKWTELVGIPAEAAMGAGWAQGLHPDDRQRIGQQWSQAVAGKTRFEMEYRFRRLDGSDVWVFGQAAPQTDDSGEICCFIGTITDITERVRAEERLRVNQSRLDHLAHHDPLTSLPNRLLFHDRLGHALAMAKRDKGRVALLFLDLDRFKNVNDSLGHARGDHLLREVAVRLRASVRDCDTVARLGGDEFLIILEEIEDVKDVAAVAQKILHQLSFPVEVAAYQLYTTASIGISLYPNDGADVDTLMKSADVAMYRAKEQGRNNYQFYTSDMNARAHELLLLESSLRHALEEEQFTLYYQPQFDLVSGDMIGLEALVRWRHPEYGIVSPADFIPLAEETGLIVPLGEWVLRAACRQNRTWQQAGHPPVRVAVNISARQFRQAGLAADIAGILSETGLDPCWLELEITESVIMGYAEKTIRTMQDISAMGVQLAIDDFGSGYSSLGYLKRFPISKLKIDQTFVRDVLTDPNDAAISASVIALAQSMSLEVIAEGIETREQLEFMRDKGCYQGQGYYFSRPLPAAEIFPALQRQSS